MRCGSVRHKCFYTLNLPNQNLPSLLHVVKKIDHTIQIFFLVLSFFLLGYPADDLGWLVFSLLCFLGLLPMLPSVPCTSLDFFGLLLFPSTCWPGLLLSSSVLIFLVCFHYLHHLHKLFDTFVHCDRVHTGIGLLSVLVVFSGLGIILLFLDLQILLPTQNSTLPRLFGRIGGSA